jgi:TetR/AcrR family transcriptional regulator
VTEAVIKHRDPISSRQKLVEAAVEVFAEHGPHQATVEEICRKAGLTKRMAYHYFGSKRGLYAAALAFVYDQFFSVEISLSTMMMPAEELLDKLVRRYYEFLDANLEFVRLICYENLNEGRIAETLHLKDKKAPIILALQLALEKGQQQDRFRKDIDVTELLASIFSLCFFYFANRHTMRELFPDAAPSKGRMPGRIQHVLGLLMRGIQEGNGQSQAAK